MSTQPTKNCNTCKFCKAMGSKIPGKRIPTGFKKCTWEHGPMVCRPHTVASGIGGARSDWDKRGKR